MTAVETIIAVWAVRVIGLSVLVVGAVAAAWWAQNKAFDLYLNSKRVLHRRRFIVNAVLQEAWREEERLRRKAESAHPFRGTVKPEPHADDDDGEDDQ